MPCWPSLELLEMWSDRRTKLFACLSNGFVDDIEFSHWKLQTATRDTVVKIGNMHVGEGKLLVRAGDDFPYWPGLATLEPYVEGRSVRVYVVNERDMPTVREFVAARYPDVRDIEYLQADLCRDDLLVEIEGVAEL